MGGGKSLDQDNQDFEFYSLIVASIQGL